MPIFLISGSREPNKRNGFTANVTECYANALRLSGADAVLYLDLPPEEAARRFDGLLLAGGGDPAPCLYGEEVLNDTVSVDEVRDAREFALLAAFCNVKKPVFGICRGLQVINVHFGGTLHQDLPAEGFRSHAETTHDLVPDGPGTIPGLAGVLRVNSYHHQAVKQLGDGLLSAARSDDGLVEAAIHESLPVFGVQWHPELAAGGRPHPLSDMQPLFDYVSALARRA
ncbi:type 1 glutamine amidotransferase [Oscillospiraceae bacterium OttesenSCG-928-G22]|nr:type 1 glutamine amidotransferase [Oscillospiraceae bacterium OttesenSCG-928-G22]